MANTYTHRIRMAAIAVAVLLSGVHLYGAAPVYASVGFGYSQPNLGSMTDAKRQNYLDLAARILGTGGTVRSTISWDPNTMSGPRFANSDRLVAELSARGLQWLPNIHTNSTSGTYIVPGSAPGGWSAFQHGVYEIAARYGPGGSYATSHPGFAGIRRYELWNEPDSPTGNAAGHMTPLIADHILYYGSKGVRSAAAEKGWVPQIYGLGLSYLKFDYLSKLYSADPNFESYMTTLSIHLYMSKDPSSCLASTTNTHCVRSLPLLRQWLDAHKAPNQTTPVKIASTEGGYSGSNGTCAPPNVVSEATQANWGTTAINWIVARPSLDFDFFSPFGLINGPNTSYTCSSGYNYQYWQNHLGAVRADGTLKPWFSAYQSLIASSP